MSYDNFKIRTFLDGKDSRDAKINDARHILNLEFYNDPSYCDSMFRWVAGQNAHMSDRIDIRLFGRKYSAANGYTTMFEMKIEDSPNIGDYYYDQSRDQYWIVTEVFEVNHIHYSGKLTLCNWVLKWQDDAGNIIEYPCQNINSTQYNSGESGNQTITLGSAQHMATVQATPDTIALKSPRRFFISRDYMIPFKVTQNDTVSNFYGNGLCKITLTQDQLNAKVDRPDLGLCDYIPEPSPDMPGQDETTISSAYIDGEDRLKYNLMNTYKLCFTGVEDFDYESDFKWNIISDVPLEQNISGNEIQLLFNEMDYIGNAILLQVVVDDEVKCEKEIKLVGLF